VADHEVAEKTIAWIAALRQEIGIPGRLREVGVTREMLPEMEIQALADGCHLCNPKEVTANDIHSLYDSAY
jgi:lactaldehyde reductase